MKSAIIRYIVLPAIYGASFASFCYLNTVDKSIGAAIQSTVEPHELSDSTPEPTKPAVPENEEIMPDVQFLNYVLRKGREGIPVLLFRHLF